jgi:hypothetical protein
LQECIFCHASRINCAPRAPDDVLANGVNPLRSLPAGCEARGAAKDAGIPRLFLQRRELMNGLDNADPAPRKAVRRFATENR